MSLTRILLALFLGLLLSCNDSNEETPNELNGTWNLKNVSGGLMGIDIDYTQGEVAWVFSQEDLQVENNIITAGPEDIYAGHETGTYVYTFQTDTNNNQVLFIDGVERGVLTVEDNVLQIDDGLAADGFITTFERN